MRTPKQNLQRLLWHADVRINGDRPWDLKVYNKKFYRRVLSQGVLGLGESYMDGWWDCEQLDEFISRVLYADLYDKVTNKGEWIFQILVSKLFNLQNKLRAFQVGKHHYDVGNNLYRKMLDKRMTYTCGYWQNAKTLDQAQEQKLDLVCKKIGLKKGDRVLDIGCGWGSFAKFAAEKYGANIVGITISKEQVKLGRELCKGLPVEIRLQDYRDVNEKFDHIISLGMFEHVGHKNYREYMKVAHRCLKKDGLFLLHTIGKRADTVHQNPWILKYIFPNSAVPGATHILDAANDLFIMEDWHNIGADYDMTLMTWFNNFDKSWDAIKDNYSKRFYRMWKFYLLSCAGGFRSRQVELWQIVFSKKGVKDGYHSIR